MLIFCHLAGLGHATFTLNVGALSSIYWMRKATTALKFFSYLSRCTLTVATAVNNLSHLMPFNRYQSFDPGLRPWYTYSIRFPRMIRYLTCWATYFSQFQAFFSSLYVNV